jgi:alpha-soluble NSF attachment protein
MVMDWECRPITAGQGLGYVSGPDFGGCLEPPPTPTRTTRQDPLFSVYTRHYLSYTRKHTHHGFITHSRAGPAQQGKTCPLYLRASTTIDTLHQAIKQEKSATGGFSFFGGKQEKYEKAVEMYRSAANAYRVKLTSIDDPETTSLAISQAGSALESAARICTDNLEEPLDAVNIYNEAFKLYHEVQPEKAAAMLEQAINKQKQLGRWRPAATNTESLAQHYQQVLGNNAKAIEAYKDTLKCYKQDPAPALENKITLALSDLQALEGDYRSAIDGYEAAADKAQNNNLLAWNIKNYLFQAGICHLATGVCCLSHSSSQPITNTLQQDMVATSRAFDEWRSKYTQFTSAREFQLLNDLKEAVEQGDQDMFADRLFQFDQMQKLNKWQTTVLLRIKEKIESLDEDFS